MKTTLFAGVLLMTATTLMAADAAPKDDVTSGIKALGDKTNYTWHTTVVVPDDTPFKPGPTDGKAEKGGCTYVKMSFGDNAGTEFALKGDKGVIHSEDAGWQSLADLQKSEGPGQFFAMIVQNFKAPVAEATDLAGASKEIKKDADTYSSDLTEAGAAKMLSWRGAENTVTNAAGSVKFWLKDGVLSKYEFKLKGTVTFGDNPMSVDRDSTVEIKDVGATSVGVPDEAMKKLQ
jgi:hypothetical protein